MSKLLGVISTVFGSILFLSQIPVYAADSTTPSTNASAICGIGENDIAVFASQFFGCGVSLIGGVALLFIIYGGFLLALSGGDPSRIRAGREYIMYAVFGLLLAIFALVILNVIGLSILKIPGFNS